MYRNVAAVVMDIKERHIANVAFSKGSAVGNVHFADAVVNTHEFTAPPSAGFYNQFNQPHYLPKVSSAGFAMQFDVMTSNDAYIGFLPGRLPSSADAYEIQLGPRSSFRLGTNGMEVVGKDSNFGIRPDQYTPLWVRMEKGILSIGAGRHIGKSVLMSAKMTPVSSQFLTMGFAGSASTATFRVNHVHNIGETRGIVPQPSRFAVTFSVTGNTVATVGHYHVDIQSTSVTIRKDKSILGMGAVEMSDRPREFWLVLVENELTVGSGSKPYVHHVAVAHSVMQDDVLSVAFSAGSNVQRVKMHEVTTNTGEFTASGGLGKYIDFNQPHFFPTVSADGFEVVVRVMTNSGAKIAFLPGKVANSLDAYEIVLGDHSALRIGTNGKELHTAAKALTLSPSTYTRVWIRLFKGTLSVGKGGKIGRDTFLNAQMPELSQAWLTLGFAGTDSTATFHVESLSNIQYEGDQVYAKNIVDYYEALRKSKTSASAYSKGHKFNQDLYKAWAKAVQKKGKMSQDKWLELQEKLAARGDPDAISILTGYAKVPKI